MQYVKLGNTGMDVSRIRARTHDAEGIAALEAPYIPHNKTGAF